MEEEEEEVSHGWTHTNVTLDGHTLISLMAKIILEQNPPPRHATLFEFTCEGFADRFLSKWFDTFFELYCCYILTSNAIPC